MPESRGSLLALIGGLLGLVAGLFLCGLRAFGGPHPQVLEEAPGNAVFALVLVSPYVIALVSVRLRARARGPLLLAASLLSLASLGISLAGAGVVFLPSVVLLSMAAARSLKAGGWRGSLTVTPVILSIIMAALVGLSFVSLLERDDPRCYAWIKYEGRTEWRSIPVQEGRSGSSSQTLGPLPPGAKSSGSTCTSDIITGREAGKGLGILAAGFVLLAVIWWYSRWGESSVLRE